MHKLYQKSEIWFAVIWIVLYVVGGGFAEGASRAIGVEKSITLIYYAGLCVVAVLWMRKHRLYELYGLCRAKIPASRFLYYIPLLVIVSCNLWFGVTWNLSVHETALYIGSMLCVGFLEEIIFRGFLFKAMCRDSIKAAIIVSSLTFGIGHIVNLFNGSGADLLSNLCQVCYAIAIGFLFVIIFYKGKSLWPCIITHSAVNAISAFADESCMTPAMEIMTAIILTVVALAYAVILIKVLPQSEEEAGQTL